MRGKEDIPYEGWTTAMFCRKYDYRVYDRQRVYCNQPDTEQGHNLERCIYKANQPDSTNMYRCMLLENQV